MVTVQRTLDSGSASRTLLLTDLERALGALLNGGPRYVTADGGASEKFNAWQMLYVARFE